MKIALTGSRLVEPLQREAVSARFDEASQEELLQALAEIVNPVGPEVAPPTDELVTYFNYALQTALINKKFGKIGLQVRLERRRRKKKNSFRSQGSLEQIGLGRSL